MTSSRPSTKSWKPIDREKLEDQGFLSRSLKKQVGEILWDMNEGSVFEDVQLVGKPESRTVKVRRR